MGNFFRAFREQEVAHRGEVVVVFGVSMPNIKQVEVLQVPETTNHEFRWQTRDGTIHRFEMGEDAYLERKNIDALLVAMRLS